MFVGKAVILRWVVVGLVVAGAMTWGYQIITSTRVESHLPVYGEHEEDGTEHKIKDFSLINQDGRTVTQDNFNDKIYVADFFFANCEGICPIMSNQLMRVDERFKNNPEVLILSHTVKPHEDSIPVLKRYAEEHEASSNWYFVTGDVREINELAKNSYLVGATEGDTDEDFVHTQFFTLIDPQKRIRGFYDGTDSTEVSRLIDDIGKLVAEY